MHAKYGCLCFALLIHRDTLINMFQGIQDLEDDVTAGFDLIHTMDIDDHGVGWIAEKIKRRIGDGPVVISLDVDVMDPSYVPASESGCSSFTTSLTSLIIASCQPERPSLAVS